MGLDWPMGGSKRGYKGYAETMCLETVLKLIVRYEPLFIMNCNNGSHNGSVIYVRTTQQDVCNVFGVQLSGYHVRRFVECQQGYGYPLCLYVIAFIK